MVATPRWNYHQGDYNFTASTNAQKPYLPVTGTLPDSSGFVEGLNNKLKVLKRRCYGLFNVGHLFQRIFIDLEGYHLFA